MAPNDLDIKVNSELDIEQLGSVFRQTGRLQIHDFLDPECARRLHFCLVEEVPWEVAWLQDGKPVYGSAAQWDLLDQTQKSQYMQSVLLAARDKFQFFYDSYRIDVAIEKGENNHLYLHRFFEFINSEGVLSLLRDITGLDEIALADGQGTRFRPGSFLGYHDDLDVAKGRLCAYVMNLTPAWRSDWGGLLHFLDPQENVEEGFIPRFNTLNLLKVPQPHAVSYVSPFAGGHRLSVTGWLRETDGSS